MTNKGDILVVDDADESLLLLTVILTGKGYTVRQAISGELALEAVAAEAPELILLDIRMPGINGFEVLKRLKTDPASIEIPVIFLSGLSETADRVKGLRLGAVDFVCKPYQNDELLAKVSTHTELSRLRKKLEQQAQEFASERDLLTALLNSISDEVWFCDTNRNFTLVNQTVANNFGISSGTVADVEKFLQRNEVFRPDGTIRPLSEAPPLMSLEGTLVAGQEELIKLPVSGELRYRQVSSNPVRGQKGEIIGSVSVVRDITEQRQLEKKFMQAQKMEAVGQLAGGVAHDFNNILGAIMCYAGFIARELAPGDPKLKDVKGILASAERAAALTAQLLAFSRRQILAPKVVDLNRLVGGTARMLRRVIGENIKLEVKLQFSACSASVDSGQIEQVIMNLALNARDAMPGGGVITLETEIINPPEEFFDGHPDLPAGPLVCLRVRDTGCGMDKEVKSHLFEPFFTTKEQSKGTGLGLPTVFGIVKQSHGEIEAESEPGQGSVFTVYLPFAETQLPETGKDKGTELAAKGSETVLFVEDEDSLRRLGERVLRSGGYTVLVAEDGQAALKLMEERGKPVDLLMTDVVMPGMSGRELGRELARRNLIGRALYMSGYTDDAIIKHGVLEPGIAFIYKPFTVDGFLLKLREVLDGPADRAKV